MKHAPRKLWNYISGSAREKINKLLIATAYFMKKWLRMKREEILNFFLTVQWP